MGALVEVMLREGSIVDLINFMLGIGVVGYIMIIKRKLDRKEQQINELREKYHLLNNMTEKVALFIEPIIKRKLIRQAPGGEWTANNPLSGD